MGPLISTVELDGLLTSRRDHDTLAILDATTLLPGEQFDPEAAFAQAHLPGARWLDLDAFSDPDSALPHMVPSQGRFARLVAALGVSNDTEVVLYDQTGVASAARAWWLFGLFGHDRVRVLDGGLPCWRKERRALEHGAAAPAAAGRFVPSLRARRLVGLGDMVALSSRAAAVGAPRLLDARSRERFEGSVPEPRAGLPGGHIPGSASLPFGELLDGDGRFRSREELRARFAVAGVGEGDAVVTSCGSGLTASVLSLGLVVAGLDPGALYDGSWTEWAQAPVPRRTGAGR